MALSSFARDMLRRSSFRYPVWILLMMGASFGIFQFCGTEPDASVPPAVTLYFLVIAVHCLRRVAQGGPANLLAPDILFLAVYSVFHHGFTFLWVLGVVPYSDRIFYHIPTVPLCLLIVNLGMLSVLLGFELCPRRSSPVAIERTVRIPTPGWAATGILVLVFGIGMHIATLLGVGIGLFLRHGYTAVARLDEYVGPPWSLVWSRSQQVFMLGLTTYVVFSSLRHGRLIASRTVAILVAGMIVLFVLEGDRGPVFMIVLSLLMARQYLIRPIRPFVLAGIIAVFFTLFTAMKISRAQAFAPGAMVAEWQQARSSREVRWWFPIVEAGTSLRVVNMTTAIVPDHQPYWYGRSWLSATTKAVPFLQGYLGQAEILREAPSQWITREIYGRGASGLGFSLPVEGYLNFGLPGVVLQMMFFGVLLRAVCVWFARRPSACTALIMIGILAPTIKVVRDHTSLVTSVYLQTLVLAWLLNVAFGSEPARYPARGRAGGDARARSLPNLAGSSSGAGAFDA